MAILVAILVTVARMRSPLKSEEILTLSLGQSPRGQRHGRVCLPLVTPTWDRVRKNHQKWDLPEWDKHPGDTHSYWLVLQPCWYTTLANRKNRNGTPKILRFAQCIPCETPSPRERLGRCSVLTRQLALSVIEPLGISRGPCGDKSCTFWNLAQGRILRFVHSSFLQARSANVC